MYILYFITPTQKKHICVQTSGCYNKGGKQMTKIRTTDEIMAALKNGEAVSLEEFFSAKISSSKKTNSKRDVKKWQTFKKY